MVFETKSRESVLLPRQCPQCGGNVPQNIDRCRTCSYAWPRQKQELTPEEQALQEIALAAADEMAGGKSAETLVAELVEVGWSDEWATALVDRVQLAMNRARRQQLLESSQGLPRAEIMRRDFAIGALSLVIGGGLTLGSYGYAAPDESYYLFYGAMVYGTIRIILGVMRLFGLVKA